MAKKLKKAKKLSKTTTMKREIPAVQ